MGPLRIWLVAILASACVGACDLKSAAAGEQPAITPPGIPQVQFWKSGGREKVEVQREGAARWAAFRHRPVDLVTDYPTFDHGWEVFVRSHDFRGRYPDKQLTLIIQTAPFPTNVGATYRQLIAGEYDAYWQRIGSILKARVDTGFAAAILSPAWEMNGGFMVWGGGTGASQFRTAEEYKRGFRRIVEQVRKTYPQVQIAWTINGHGSCKEIGSTDAFDFYPGDAFVNYMGIDDYDHSPAAPTREQFEARARANGGIWWLADHARKHGKQILVPEWGVAGDSRRGGGDNPSYIQWMFETFRGWHAEGLLAGEYYFVDLVGGGGPGSDLIHSNPLSRKRYVRLWSLPPDRPKRPRSEPKTP